MKRLFLLLAFLIFTLSCADAGDRRVRHLMFSSKALGAKLSLFAPAITGLANGDPVGTWTDLSGNGNGATASGGSRPTYISSAAGSLPTTRWSANAMSTPSISVAGITMISVCQRSWTTNGSYRCLLSQLYPDPYPSSNNGIGVFDFGETLEDWIAGDLGAFGNGYVAPHAPRAIGPNPVASGAIVWSVALSATEAYSEINGTLNSTRSSSTGPISYNAPLFIGSTNGGVQQWDGDISAMLVFTSAVPDPLRSRLEQSLGYTFRIATY